jgi:hypothetical protein
MSRELANRLVECLVKLEVDAPALGTTASLHVKYSR